MEKDVIVRKAFGLPCGIKGILGDGFAVHADVDVLFLLGIAGLDIARQPAFYAPSLIVVGSGAFFPVISPAFKAVDENLRI